VLFEKVRYSAETLYPSVEAEARGWGAAMTGEFGVEERKTGRGERTQPSGTDLNVPVVWALPVTVAGPSGRRR